MIIPTWHAGACQELQAQIGSGSSAGRVAVPVTGRPRDALPAADAVGQSLVPLPCTMTSDEQAHS